MTEGAGYNLTKSGFHLDTNSPVSGIVVVPLREFSVGSNNPLSWAFRVHGAVDDLKFHWDLPILPFGTHARVTLLDLQSLPSAGPPYRTETRTRSVACSHKSLYSKHVELVVLVKTSHGL